MAGIGNALKAGLLAALEGSAGIAIKSLGALPSLANS